LKPWAYKSFQGKRIRNGWSPWGSQRFNTGIFFCCNLNSSCFLGGDNESFIAFHLFFFFLWIFISNFHFGPKAYQYPSSVEYIKKLLKGSNFINIPAYLFK